MSNIKRVSLTSIESNNDKVKTKTKGSFRISIPIVEEPSSKDYSRFNYETLYKSALDKKRLKKDTNGAQNGLTNGGGLEVEDDAGDEDEVAKLAKKFEQKYGGTQKKDNYSELGAGYDEEDSFIDNTDAYNDEMSEDLLPKHGGYYLNRGNLELQRIDLPEEVIENEEEICRKKIKRTINVIQSSDEEGDEAESSEAEESGRDENDEDDDEEEEEDDEDEESEEPENEGELEEKAEKKPEARPDENGLGTAAPPVNDLSILSTIESVIGNHQAHAHKDEVSVIKKKKKRKREREETEEAEHQASKQRKQERENKSACAEGAATSSSKHHKHAKKHKDRSHEARDRTENKTHEVQDWKENKTHESRDWKENKSHESRDCKENQSHESRDWKENKSHESQDWKENKEKPRKVAPATVKELLGERKPADAMATPPPSTPTTVSLPTSEDVEMSDDLNPLPSSEPPLVNGHLKDEACNASPNLPLTDLKIPETLPDEIRDLIADLKQETNHQATNLSSRKNFPAQVNSLLINLEAKCRTISSANKNAVYAHLVSFLPLSKETLIKRVRKMSVDKEEEKLEAIISKLKLKIDSVMPGVLLQYSKDCEIATKKAASEKAMENASGDQNQKPAENHKPQLPRRVFPWDEELRSYVRELIDIKATCFRIMNCRKDTEDDYIKDYLETKVKPLWPNGWMKSLVLLREGRSTSSMPSRKYTPKPASKKVVPSQPTNTPPEPHPLHPPKHKAETMLLSAKAQTLLSSLAAVNSLSYQKPSEPSPQPLPLPLPLPNTSPSLFSQIQSSLSKAPPVQSTSSGTNTDGNLSTPPVSSSSTTCKKVSPPPLPKPSPSPSPHSISNLINTTKAHVSSSKYNHPPAAHIPNGNSSNSFSVKSQGDLLPVSTSLSTLLLQSQSYLPSLAYGLCSLPSTANPTGNLPPSLSTFCSPPSTPSSAGLSTSLNAKSCSTATSPLYKLPPFSQPSPSFPIPTSSPSSSPCPSRKSVSPHSASSPPKKRMSTPSPTLSDPSDILDLSPASISYSSKHQDRSVSPMSLAKPPSIPQHREHSTSPVSSKVGATGGSMLSLKQRILQESAKTSTPAPSLHAPYLDDPAKPSQHPSMPSPQSLRESPSIPEVSVSAANALSQMINDSLLGTPGSFGSLRSEHIPTSSINVGLSRSEHTYTPISGGPLRSEHSASTVSAGGLSRSEPTYTPTPISGGQLRSEHIPNSLSGGSLRPDHIPNSSSSRAGRLELNSAINASVPPSSTSVGVSRSEHLKSTPLITGVYQSHPMNTTIGVCLSVPSSTPSALPPCSEPRQRKSSRSSSKDSDGKESEIVADVLKSLMSLNQMSENSGAGSPDKSKVFHEASSGGPRSSDVNNKSTSPTSGVAAGAVPKIHMGFEDEFKRHLNRSGPAPRSAAPEFPKDMKMKTFQAEQLLVNSPTASEFSMRMPPAVTSTPPPHVTQDS